MIEGVSAIGKTSVCHALDRRGLLDVSGDVGLSTKAILRPARGWAVKGRRDPPVSGERTGLHAIHPSQWLASNARLR